MSNASRDLVSLARESFGKYRDRPLFGTRTAGGWTWTTYGEVEAAVDAMRAGLATLGVTAGDRVALVASNRVEWAAAAYATYGLGASFVPMYLQQRVDEWEHILGDCGAKVVIGAGEHAVAALTEMRERLPALAHVIALDATRPGTIGFEEVLDRGRAHPVAAIAPDPDAIAGFIYTSGTTGKPKGVLLTHRNIASNVAAGLSVFPILPEDRTLSFLPWAHAYGQVIELHVVVAAGASTAFVTDVSKLVEQLAEVQPTILVAVPRIFNRLYAGMMKQVSERPRFVQTLFRGALRTAGRHRRGERTTVMEDVGLRLADRVIFSKIRKRVGGRLKYAISASATLSLDVAEVIDAVGIQVYEGYGLTETSPIVSANIPSARRLGSVGRVIPGVRILIDESLGDGPGRGEIIVYGPNVMKGYHNRPDENAKAFTPDGGFRTGDLGRIDDDGYLYITGRIKEQYKLENGKYVMPSPLEEQLKLSPYVLNVMMYGESRPFNVALIVIDAAAVRGWAERERVVLGADLTKDPQVIALMRREIERLGASFRGYERPNAFVLTTEDFTIENGLLTPSLKLKRREAVKRYGAGLESLYLQAPVEAHVE